MKTKMILRDVVLVVVLALVLVSVASPSAVAVPAQISKPSLLIETPSGLLGWDCPNGEGCGYFWFSKWGARKNSVDFSKEDWSMSVADPSLGLYLVPYQDPERGKVTLAMFKDNSMVWLPPVSWGELWGVGSPFGNPPTPTPGDTVLLTVMLGYEKMTKGGAVSMSLPLYFSTEGHFAGIPPWIRTE